MTRPLFVLCLVGLAAAGCSEEGVPLAPAQEVDVDAEAALVAAWPEPVSVYDFDGMEERMGLSEEDAGVASFRRRASRCAAEPHRQFDFWLGQWDGNDPVNGPIGQNEIKVALDGCLITEDFIGAIPVRGRSLNAYDRATGEWLQTFVSETSTNFRLSGGLVGDEMIMTANRLFLLPSGNLFPVVDRITWSELDGGSVRQLIELSIDGGESFPFTLSDIRYTELDPYVTGVPVGTDSCSDAPFRELDYWEGEWTVKLGRWPIGVSSVSVDMSGCLVEENFRSWRGHETRSFFSYDNTTESWHRTYVDDRGNAFRLEGPAADGVVGMAGTRPLGSESIDVQNTVKPHGNGVVQEWAVSLPGSNHTASVQLQYVRR